MKRSYFTIGSMLILFGAAGLEAQTLSVDKPALAFSAQAGGAAVSQTLNVTSSSGSVPFQALSNVSWLKVNPTSGTATTSPSALSVTADPTGLPLSATPYQGTLTIFGGTSSVQINVTLTVGALSVSPGSVAFTYQMGANSPQPVTVNISSAQSTNINLAASEASGGSWLQVSPASGASPGTATISVNQTVLQTLSPNTYNGTVTITPTSGPSTIPATVSVTLTVSPAPPVTISPAAITLDYQIGGTNNSAQQTLTLATTGSQGVSYGLAAGVSPNPSGRIWFTVSPQGGTIPANGNTQVTVAYDTTANLTAGTWTGTITLMTPGGTPAQQTINVTLLVSSSPLVNVANPALTFNYQMGTTAPPQNVTVSSTGTQLPLTISTTPANSWLSAPTTGVTGTAFAVSVNPTGLQPATYNGTVNITATGAANGPLQISVTLVVSNNPVIVVTTNGCSTAVNPSCSLLFADQIGQPGPPSQNISITSTTGAALNYTVTGGSTQCGGAWLLPADSGTLATSGTTNAIVPIYVNAGGIAAGSACTGNLSITATIAATGAAAPNSPLTIPVNMYVSNSDLLVASPYALSFTAAELGQSPAAQTISLTSTGTNALTYTVAPALSSGSNWLFVNQVSGSTAAGSSQLAVQVTPGLLSPGTYFGSIAITATGPGSAAVADSPITIPITFQVTAGTMAVSPTTLSFTQSAGASASAAQTISVTNSGAGAQTLSYNVTAAVTTTSGSVNWLTATPASGATPGTISVTADGSKLPAGVYNGIVTVTATTPNTQNATATIPVSLTVLAGTIAATPTPLTFTQAVGGTAPPTQPVSVTGTPGAISFGVATSEDSNCAAANWLSATPTTGTTPATVTVSASAGSLPVGTCTGKVTITAASPGANGSPITIPVTLNVVTGQTLTVTPATLNFNYALGASAPAAQTAQVTASGTAAAPFTTSIATTPSGGTWLQVSPTSGNTPATLSVSIGTTGLAVGNYTGTITISSSNSLNPVTVTVNLAVSPAIPTPVISAIANAASYSTGGVAPAENIVIFGTGIGPATLTGGTLTSSNAFSTTAGNTQVTFDGTPAPVIYASSGQTSVMVPYGVSGRTVTTIRVSYQGVLSAPLIYNVTTTAPGIYTQNSSGTGPGAILNQDYSVNGPTKPAAKGSAVAVYMTGEGVTNTVPADGAIAPGNGTGLYKPLLPVTATVGGIPATVLYYGTAPGIVYGVMQVNLTIPASVSSGPQPVVITVGTNTTQTGVTVAVQ